MEDSKEEETEEGDTKIQGSQKEDEKMSEVMIPLSAVAYLLVSWSVIIAVVNLTLWYYLLKKRLPATEKKYIDLIEEKEKKYMKKLDNIVEGKDEKFNTILDKKLPDITKGLKTEFKKVLDEEGPKLFDAFMEKLAGPPTPQMVGAINTIGKGMYYNMSTDPEIERSIQGKINGYMNGIAGMIDNKYGLTEDDIKNLKELIAFFNANKEKFAQYANMVPGGGGGGGGAPFDIMGMLTGRGFQQ